MPIDQNACPGACNAKVRREHRTYDEEIRAYDKALADWDGTPETEPVRPQPPRTLYWLGDPVWCVTDTATLRQELAELDDLAALAAARSDGHREPTREGRVSGTTTPPSPSPTVEDLDELESWLREWRATYAGTETPARQGFLATAVTTNVAWLLARAERILARPEYGADFGREIHAWHTRLAQASKTSIQVQRKPLRCPRCHLLRLEHRDGDDSVRCASPGCGRVIRLDEYDAMVEHAATTRRAS